MKFNPEDQFEVMDLKLRLNTVFQNAPNQQLESTKYDKHNMIFKILYYMMVKFSRLFSKIKYRKIKILL